MHNEECIAEQTVKQQICFIKTVCCFYLQWKRMTIFFIMDCLFFVQKKNLYHKRNRMEELTLWMYMDMCVCPVWIRTRTGR